MRDVDRSRSWRLLFGVAAVALLFFAVLGDARTEETGRLIVVVTGLTSDKGDVLIELANTREDYEEDERGFRAASAKPSDGKAEQRFDGVPYGDYALKILHDENSNKKIDIGWTGPEERYGFSNGARGTFSPPDWADAKFHLDQPEKTVSVEVR